MNKNSKQAGNANHRGDGSNLKDRILIAARALFFEEGYYATSTRKIAAEAGTSESSIFRLFPEGKYQVLMAVYDDCWREVNEAIDDRLPDQYQDPRRRVLDVLRVVWSLYEERTTLMSFIIINTGNTDTLLVARKEKAIITAENLRYVKRIDALCCQSAARGLLPGGVTPVAAREGILGVTEGVLLGWYLADKGAQGHYPKKVTLDEAVTVAAVLLNCNTAEKAEKERQDSNGVSLRRSRSGLRGESIVKDRRRRG